MTAPLNQGILSGFPPTSVLGGGAAPTIVTYATAGTFLYQIPLGVTRIAGDLWGSGETVAAPGGNTARWGSSGHYVAFSLAVQAGEYLTILVAAASKIASTISRGGVELARAAGGGGVGGNVGDLVLVGADGFDVTLNYITAAVDNVTINLPLPLNMGPRGAAPANNGAGFSVNVSVQGVWPGGGAAIVAAGSGAAVGSAGGCVLYVPNPVNLT